MGDSAHRQEPCELAPGSTAFIQEAARRARSNSVLGHIVISSRTQTARNDVRLSWDDDKANPTYDGSGSKQLADLSGAGTTFGFEDRALSSGADADDNDMIFRLSGATGTAPVLSTVVSHRSDMSQIGLESQILA